MSCTSRFAIAAFVAIVTAGCGKGASDAAPADTTARAPATATAATATTPPAPTAAAPAAATAAADVTYHWETHGATHLKFELPTTWSTQPMGANVLVAKTPTPGVGVEFTAAAGGLAAKSDEKAMLTEVGKTLQGAKFTSKMKPVEQHGLKGFVATGTGTKDGKEVAWFTSAVGDGKGHAMLTLGFYSPTAAPAYKAQLVHILDSIQPAG